MEKSVQELFDEFVKEHGAEATVLAIKGHVHPDGGGTCPEVPCGAHYVCSGGKCVLDIGR